MTSRTVLRLLLAIVGLGLTLRFGPLWYVRASNLIPMDWNVYWVAVERLLSGQAFYGVPEPKPFKYSPIFLYAFRSTFFLLEKKLAVALWMGLSALSFFTAYALTADQFISRLPSDLETGRNQRFFALVALLALPLSWHGVVETLSYGQTELFCGAGLLALMSGKPGPWVRAAIWAFFFSMKPHMGIILLASSLCTGREGFKELLRAGVATAIVYLLPSLWLGPVHAIGLLGDWVRSVQGQHDLALFLWNTNQSVPAAIARILHAPHLFIPLTVLGLAGALGWAALQAKRPARRIDPALGIAYGVLTYLCFAPLSWRWFIALWPLGALALAFSLPRARALRSLAPWAVLALLTISPFSKLLGLQAEDRLSELGFHAWASFALLCALSFALPRGHRASTA